VEETALGAFLIEFIPILRVRTVELLNRVFHEPHFKEVMK
jgi:hypothetical protein